VWVSLWQSCSSQLEPGFSPEKDREMVLAILENLDSQALEILGIIESGQHGAIHGTMTMSDGQKFGFTDFYEFSDGKVQLLTSYVSQL